MAIKSQIEVIKGNSTKVVSTKNDELIVYNGVYPQEDHCFAGFELKKKVKYKHVSQAVAELVTFARKSKFPILQVSAIVCSFENVDVDYYQLIYGQILTDLDLSVAFYFPAVNPDCDLIQYRLFSCLSRQGVLCKLIDFFSECLLISRKCWILSSLI